MADLEVLYNAECPICRREIEHYERLSGDKVKYIKITADTAADWGLSEDQAAEQLHARCGVDLVIGVDAFVSVHNPLPLCAWCGQAEEIQPRFWKVSEINCTRPYFASCMIS